VVRWRLPCWASFSLRRGVPRRAARSRVAMAGGGGSRVRWRGGGGGGAWGRCGMGRKGKERVRCGMRAERRGRFEIFRNFDATRRSPCATLCAGPACAPLDLVLLSRYPFGKHFSFSARLPSPTSFHLQMGPRCTFIGQHLLGKFNPKMIENCQSPLSPPHHLEKAIIIIHIIYYLLMLFLAIIGIN
jgi:hypothetical protein